MKLAESVLNRSRIEDDPVRAEQEWEPVFEQTPSRRLEAPSLRLCAITDIGRRRRKNEDEFFLSGDGGLWIVADGMGGCPAGEIASSLAVYAISEAMDSAGPYAALDPASSTPDRLLRAFALAHRWVQDRSLKDDACRGMGSTAIAGVIDGDILHTCHVGDVRAYHLSRNKLCRTTNDQSLVGELVESGMLTPDEARSHPQRGWITQAIGIRDIKPGINRVALQPGDRILLCSDGLWGAVTDEEIAAIAGSDGSARQLACLLVDRANAAGGSDNITVVLYEHSAGR